MHTPDHAPIRGTARSRNSRLGPGNVPPAGVAARACERPVSEHAVRVREVLGHRLDDVPVLDDLAVLEPEEIGECATGLAGLEDQLGVRCDHVALGDGSFDVQGEIGILGAQPIYEADERFRPIVGLGIVLDVDRAKMLSNGALRLAGKGCAVVVEDDRFVLFRGGLGTLLLGGDDDCAP